MQTLPDDPKQQKLQVAKMLARLMDSAFTIPGTKHRVGLDPLLGLLPVAGDVIGFAISLYIVILARQMGMSKAQLTIMCFNVLVDSTLGAVPVLGDAVDLFWRANIRNIEMMERHLLKHERKSPAPKSRTRPDVPASEQTIDVVAESLPADRS